MSKWLRLVLVKKTYDWYTSRKANKNIRADRPTDLYYTKDDLKNDN